MNISWKLCITFTFLLKMLILHTNDIYAAFCQITYSPDMVIIFTYYVFAPFLVIPVGQVFGFGLALSLFFSLALDLWVDAATIGDMSTTFSLQPLSHHIMLPDPPNTHNLAPAVADAINYPLSMAEQYNLAFQQG
jgi:hypothetical protein